MAQDLLRQYIMAVHIETRSEHSKTTVSVAGRLEGSGVREFLNICHSIEGTMVIDLSGLRSGDSEGLDAIRELNREGAELRGVSPFIELLLDQQSSADGG